MTNLSRLWHSVNERETHPVLVILGAIALLAAGSLHSALLTRERGAQASPVLLLRIPVNQVRTLERVCVSLRAPSLDASAPLDLGQSSPIDQR